MSFSYDRYDRRRTPQPVNSSRRTTFGYWLPLALTVSVATAGVVAWVWSQRSEHETDDSSSSDEHLDYGRNQYYAEQRPGGPDAGQPGQSGGPPGLAGVDARQVSAEQSGWAEKRDQQAQEDTIYGRVQGVLRRTPSPQQAMDFASKKVSQGVAAATAVVGGALQSITEEGDHYGDHNRWSEEAASRKVTGGQRSLPAGVRKRNVVFVVSAEAAPGYVHDQDAGYRSEHASILSHLPHIDPALVNVFVLIYAPHLAAQTPTPSFDNKDDGAASLASSCSAVSTPAQTPGEELTHIDPQPHQTAPPSSGSSERDFRASQALYERLAEEAHAIVSKPTMAMPYATPTGCVHMLRHLSPDTVYVIEALAGADGEVVRQVKGWVGQVVVVVGTDGGGLGGLVDTEDEMSGREAAGPDRRSKGSDVWWRSGDLVGLGKGVEVVDGIKVGEDFERRVLRRE